MVHPSIQPLLSQATSSSLSTSRTGVSLKAQRNPLASSKFPYPPSASLLLLNPGSARTYSQLRGARGMAGPPRARRRGGISRRMGMLTRRVRRWSSSVRLACLFAGNSAFQKREEWLSDLGTKRNEKQYRIAAQTSPARQSRQGFSPQTPPPPPSPSLPASPAPSS